MMRSDAVDQRTEGILLILLMIGVSLVFQVQMKLLASAIGLAVGRAQGWFGGFGMLVATFLSWRGFFVVLLAGIAFLLWLMALARLELSFALPIASISLIVTAIGGALWLGEELSWIRIAGLLTTAVGIGLVMSS
jgi:drug/metabolite transporter (DMT)-like permease